jgi:hypothetical protein
MKKRSFDKLLFPFFLMKFYLFCHVDGMNRISTA